MQKPVHEPNGAEILQLRSEGWMPVSWASTWAPQSTTRRPLTESDLLIAKVRQWLLRRDLTHPRSQLMTHEPRSPESPIFPFFDTHQSAFEIFFKLGSWELLSCIMPTIMLDRFWPYLFLLLVFYCWIISDSQPVIEPGPWQRNPGILATRPPGNTPSFLLFIKIFMWIIFKIFIEFVTILLLFYVLAFWPWDMWGFSSPTRDQTHMPCIGRWSLNHWTAREVPISPF